MNIRVNGAGSEIRLEECLHHDSFTEFKYLKRDFCVGEEDKKIVGSVRSTRSSDLGGFVLCCFSAKKDDEHWKEES